jgi:prolyl 4-hydroxylase
VTVQHRNGLVAGQVNCVDGVLTEQECAALLADLRYAWWWRSPLVHARPDGTLLTRTSQRRTSRTTSEEWFTDDAMRIVRRLERRLADHVAFDPACLEMWQAARYRRGEHFEEHHDAGFFGADPWGEREITLLVYLNGAADGGSTKFPRLKCDFRPAPGRALIWPNLLPDGSVDERMRHSARPARTVKTILTTWVRQRPTRHPSA